MTQENKEIFTENVTEHTTIEPTETMDDYKDALEHSFRKIKEGDLLTGTILDVSDEGITLDIGYFTDGFIPNNEISKDPGFCAQDNYRIGDSISAVVISLENENGSIDLSLNETADLFSWDKLKEGMEQEKIYSVHIADTVPAGLITYLENIRGFIPISQISTQHIDDTSAYANQTLEVMIITVDKSQNKLVLSAKKVEQTKEANARSAKISSLQKGLITTGIVEKLMPYGAFVRLEDNLSGLVHISEICGRRLQSPKEVLHEGDQVTVKIINVDNGKISLSIKQAEAVSNEEDVVEHVSDVPTEYISEESSGTSLATLLAKLNI